MRRTNAREHPNRLYMRKMFFANDFAWQNMVFFASAFDNYSERRQQTYGVGIRKFRAVGAVVRQIYFISARLAEIAFSQVAVDKFGIFQIAVFETAFAKIAAYKCAYGNFGLHEIELLEIHLFKRIVFEIAFFEFLDGEGHGPRLKVIPLQPDQRAIRKRRKQHSRIPRVHAHKRAVYKLAFAEIAVLEHAFGESAIFENAVGKLELCDNFVFFHYFFECSVRIAFHDRTFRLSFFMAIALSATQSTDSVNGIKPVTKKAI